MANDHAPGSGWVRGRSTMINMVRAERHKIMSVTLAKTPPAPVHPFGERQWSSTVDLYLALDVLFSSKGRDLYEGLSNNDLRGLSDTLAYWTRYDNTTGTLVPRTPGFVNYPTLRPGQSTVTDGRTDARTPDYSDGYGGTYAVGE